MADRRGRTEKDFCFVCSTREVHGLRKYSRGNGRGNEGSRTEPAAKLLSKLRTSSLALGTSPVQGKRLDLLFPWKKWLVPTSASSRLQKIQFLPRIFHLLNK